MSGPVELLEVCANSMLNGPTRDQKAKFEIDRLCFISHNADDEI